MAGIITPDYFTQTALKLLQDRIESLEAFVGLPQTNSGGLYHLLFENYAADANAWVFFGYDAAGFNVSAYPVDFPAGNKIPPSVVLPTGTPLTVQPVFPATYNFVNTACILSQPVPTISIRTPQVIATVSTPEAIISTDLNHSVNDVANAILALKSTINSHHNTSTNPGSS